MGAALAEGLTSAIGGSGRVALLLGEAGMGKTTMARLVATSARRQGVTVRWSACSSGGATVAHAPWLTLLSGLGTAGRRAMDSLLGSQDVSGDGAGAASASARASAYASVVRAVEEATAERPALLVLDDLHWADEGTLQLLDVVAAHVPGLPVLVVGTYRDTDVQPGSRLTDLGGRADRMALHPLDAAAVAALLGDQLGPVRAEELAGEVSRLTGGNPFLVIQIGRLLVEDPDALTRGALPTGARDLLRQRLASLSADDRELLAAAAVLGSPFRAIDLQQVLARFPAEVVTALDRAAAARIVERAPGTGAWAFMHDLFRQAAAGEVGPLGLADLHRSVAAVLERTDAEPAVIAAHLLAAEEGTGGRDAAAWSVRAGDRAVTTLAWEEAAGHYERALDALPRDSGADVRADGLAGGSVADVRADGLAGLGRARLLAGDVIGAGRAFDELATLGRGLGSAPLLARAALGFSADLSGFEVRLFDQHQIDLLEEAALALRGRSAPGMRAMVLARLSVALSLVAPGSRRRELAEEAVALAREAGEPVVLGRALAAHCDVIAGPADVARREAEASEIIAIATAEGDGPLEMLGRRLRYVARLEQGDIVGVEEDTGAFTRRAEALGNPLYSWFVPLWKAQLAIVAGDLEPAERGIDEAEALGRSAGSLNGPILAQVLRLLLAWQRGANARVVADVDAIARDTPELAVHFSAIGSFAWAYVCAERPADAVSLLDRAAAVGLDTLAVDAEWLANMVNVVRAAAAVGHPILPDALARIEPHAELVAFEGIGAGLYGSVGRFVAIGCRALGRHDDAVRHARRALARNRGFGGTLVGDAQRTLAESLAAGGDHAEADRLDAEADATYRAVGALHLVRSAAGPRRPASSEHAAAGGELRRAGDVWHIGYQGTNTILKHSKGLADLAVLLACPGQEVHVAELEGVPATVTHGHGGDALDRRAIAAYRDRLTELAEELDEAEAHHDLGRAERARIEHDALVDQLAGAVGIGGRRRAAGPEPIERLRKAVSARIRDAIRRVEAAHPALGRHLANAVHTGTFCSYRPEAPTVWRGQIR